MTAQLEQFRATLDIYRRHGWQLARALMTPPTLAELQGALQTEQPTFEGAPVTQSDFDAMWFRRASAAGREAWELRLAAETYALFELFEADEAEEDREDVRRELEQRVRDRLSGETIDDER